MRLTLDLQPILINLLSSFFLSHFFILTPPPAVLRNPIYFFFLFVLSVIAYVTYQLNLWGPMIKMANAAFDQALHEGKRKLREFLADTETGRQAMAMSARPEEYELAGSKAKKEPAKEDEDDF